MCDGKTRPPPRPAPPPPPPAKGLFLSAHFPLTSSKMPSRIHLKLLNETKIKKGIE